MHFTHVLSPLSPKPDTPSHEFRAFDCNCMLQLPPISRRLSTLAVMTVPQGERGVQRVLLAPTSTGKLFRSLRGHPRQNSPFQLARNWPTINRRGTGVPLKNQWPIRRSLFGRICTRGCGDRGEDRSSSIKDKRREEGEDGARGVPSDCIMRNNAYAIISGRENYYYSLTRLHASGPGSASRTIVLRVVVA